MLNRRSLLKQFLFLNSLVSFSLMHGKAESNNKIFKIIPSSKEKIPAIGMGTWLTFDVGYNSKKIRQRALLLDTFFKFGGTIIDTSPMYGSAEKVVGKCLKILNKKEFFCATKIWTPNSWHGKVQFKNSKELMGLEKIKLLQVHNLVNYQKHLDYMYELKEKKLIKYIGVTTSHERRHDELKRILQTYDLDFVQLTYNLIDRKCEKFLLPLAKEKGIAVIANRPFQGGNLFAIKKNTKLPNWCKELKINSWPELFLKYVISNPSISCAIPATSKQKHMEENMKSLYGNLLNNEQRNKLEIFVKNF